ncbi:helix-turn-helix transcriptional regulator [uncultured Adlercreutzia sp.]|uniref:helix-turn-helix transcriptional regulator n=1 Tax=uncultured Adlercreutzia sp. TaxID=875803 RepID=UPI0025E2F2AE|nr:helix-turn-helix domain-containing protein [uncultured Adlercreutzia sp.]MCI9262134.1 helix-turn-helix domain-containing protein [Eggerthellaceae bacterium]
MELPQQLKANRERLGLTQEDVAQRIFVSRQTMSSWETGKTYPDVQSLLLLSNLFGVSIDSLVKGDVETMKETIVKDAVRMERLSIGMVGLLLAGVACLVGWDLIWDEPVAAVPWLTWGVVVGMALFALCAALAMVCACRVEKLKKDHDLVTFREISAFMDGEDAEAIACLNPDAFSRKHPWVANVVKVLAGAAVALALGFIVGSIVSSLH